MKKQRGRIKSNSLLVKLLLPMLVLNLVLSFLFYGTIVFGGTMSELEKNAAEILSGTLSGRADYLQKQMNSVWGNFDENLREIEATVSQALKVYDRATFDTQRYIQNNPSPLDGRNSVLDIGKNYEGSRDYLSDFILKSVTPDLEKLLRQNYVNGAYLILNGDDSKVDKDGLYFRRISAASNAIDRTDLILLVAPPKATVDSEFCADFGTKTNSMSAFMFGDSGAMALRDIYYQVFDNARAAADTMRAAGQSIVNDRFSPNYSYWAPCYGYLNIAGEIISYNMPLVYNGYVYGVFGIDVNVNTITPMLNPLEIMGNSTSGSYVLSVRDSGSDTLNKAVYSGTLYNKLYGTQSAVPILQRREDSLYRLQDGTVFQTEVYAAIKQLSLYNNHTPYEDMIWELAAIVERDELFSFSSELMFTLLQSVLVGFVVSAAAVVALSLYLSRPIKRIAEEVRTNHSLDKTFTAKTNIYELDELVSEIQTLAASVADSASKLEQIIGTAGVAIGAYEWLSGADKVFYTGKIFELLQIPFKGESSGYLNADTFSKMLNECEQYLDGASSSDSEKIYHIGESRVRLHITDSDGSILGVVTDITREMREKEKIEYERDHDALTQLYNRRAFCELADAIFTSANDLKATAVLMIDLNKLKDVNDRYGHEVGDKYIIGMANILQETAAGIVGNGYVSRLAGDEFAVLLYGYDSKDEIRMEIATLIKRFQETQIQLSAKETTVLSASVGVAWYPHHGRSLDELLQKADSAMYQAKSSLSTIAVEYGLDKKKL